MILTDFQTLSFSRIECYNWEGEIINKWTFPEAVVFTLRKLTIYMISTGEYNKLGKKYEITQNVK